MSHNKSAQRGAAAPPLTLDPGDERLKQIRARPDGYHWIDVQGRQEFGPFATVEEALADMDGPDDEAIEQAAYAEPARQGLGIDADVDQRADDDPEVAT